MILLSTPMLNYASNDIYNMEIKNAMDSMPKKVKTQLGDFKFYFGKDSKPFEYTKGETIYTSNRSNGVLKSNLKACNWVFYSALIDLKKQAQAVNGKGVANIESNWKNNPTNNSKTFVCAEGLIMTGVALKGNIIR
ncbi:excinuclease [Francisella halioticida]|uniref:excinuclease n=1 Tax=Francisella halioticida TaxID=549298 RepID=UPI001FEC360A|nr:excinuclease [Francisella halioticida]